MEPVQKVSIISRSRTLSIQMARDAASAIQLQVLRDFNPIWQRSAVITALPSPQVGFVPVFVVDDLAGNLSGYHFTDEGLPFAIVKAGPLWCLTASHEILELLADPTADERVRGVTPDGRTPCEYILEVCDPCQDFKFSYLIGEWTVSDFCLPRYFDSVATPGAAYSFQRHVTSPRQVLSGGTLGWIAQNGHAYQAVYGKEGLQTHDRGIFVPGPQPSRTFIGRFDQTFSDISELKISIKDRRELSQIRKERKEYSEVLSEKFDAHIHKLNNQ